MKNRVYATKKMLGVLLSTLLLGCVVVGCIDEKDHYKPDEKPSGVANSFDFATTQDVQLDLKYDIPAENYQVLFELYFENPLTTDADGQVVKRTDIVPKVVRMTDGTGVYRAKETIPAYGEEVYIYTSYIGVPMLYKTKIEGNTITADINWDTAAEASVQTRVGGEYQTVPEGFYTLGSWDIKGRPNYLDNEGVIELTPAFYRTINKTIPEDGNCPQKYRQSVDFMINDEHGAEVKVRFIGGTSAAYSAFGYYCYSEGANVAQIRKAKKYVVFPNTKTGVGIKGGECVKLHYIDADGEDKGTVFPKGTKIGWFISNDAFTRNGTTTNGNVGKGRGMFYSTTALNDKGRKHTAAFKINEFIVLSFEDWTSQDYNDVMFNVWSNPIEAIIPPDMPSVDPEDPDDQSIAYKMTYKGILAFEDNWPSKGDYDLNDVIVKYNSVLSFNTKNQVLSTEDTFTAMWSGALFKNGFAYQMNTERANVEECDFIEGKSAWGSQGLDNELSQATVAVFANAIEETGSNTKTSVFKIRNKFKQPVDHETFGVAPYNSFIFLHQNTGKDRTEVHLVNHKPTDKVNTALFGSQQDLSDTDKGIYYVSDQNYPFAIHLADVETFNTEEKESIDQSYPRFASWAKSGGKTDKDWYLKK